MPMPTTIRRPEDTPGTPAFNAAVAADEARRQRQRAPLVWQSTEDLRDGCARAKRHEGGVRPFELGAKAELFTRHALALLLAVALPALAGDSPRPPRPGDHPAAVAFCRAHPNGSGQVKDASCVGGIRQVECDGDLPGLTYCGTPRLLPDGGTADTVYDAPHRPALDTPQDVGQGG